MKRRSSSCATCSHSGRKHSFDRAKGKFACTDGWAYSESAGWYIVSDSEGCYCPGFLAPEIETPKKAAGRLSRKRGEQAEKRIERMTGERKRGGPGRPDNAKNETKVMTKQVRGHIKQALRLGGYEAVVRYVDLDGDLGIWELRRV